MIKVTSSVEIEHDPNEVFQYIADPENNPQWQSGMKSCKWESKHHNWIGSTYIQEASFLGKEIESTFEIIDFQQGYMIKGQSISGTFPITFTRIVESTSNGCKVTAIVEGDPKGVFKIAQPLMTWMVKYSVEKDYQKLKSMFENENSD